MGFQKFAMTKNPDFVVQVITEHAEEDMTMDNQANMTGFAELKLQVDSKAITSEGSVSSHHSHHSHRETHKKNKKHHSKKAAGNKHVNIPTQKTQINAKRDTILPPVERGNTG